MTNKIKILIIEDEQEIRKFLQVVFDEENFECKFTNNARDGIKTISLYPPEIVILDLGLPDLDGLEVIQNIRQWSQVPIIVLSARDMEEDKVQALELGANDYLTKPFGSRELLARIRVILRYCQKINQNSSPLFEIGDLKVDLQNRQLFVKGKKTHLTKIEYKLLSVFVKNAGKLLTHSYLLKEVWGKNSTENSHYLRIYTQHLRGKLQDDPINPKYIFTEVGVGYRFISN
ncbi:MAG: response regulator [Rickettsiales bacterium]|nr:response regulator [Rickettsiales bacterium]